MAPSAGKVDAAVVTVYADDSGEWRWRAKDTNGDIVADSAEGYVDRTYAEGAAQSLFPKAEFDPPLNLGSEQ
jgi:uncharacterized protein YegP (UPF0339 family)